MPRLHRRFLERSFVACAYYSFPRITIPFPPTLSFSLSLLPSRYSESRNMSFFLPHIYTQLSLSLPFFLSLFLQHTCKPFVANFLFLSFFSFFFLTYFFLSFFRNFCHCVAYTKENETAGKNKIFFFVCIGMDTRDVSLNSLDWGRADQVAICIISI